MKLFSIENLSFSYEKQRVLENINLNYDDEDFLVIIGENGGGKSTLVRLILGLLQGKSGQIKLFIDKKQIAYVPQNTLFNKDFDISVLELVLMGLVGEKIFGFYTKEQKERALKALKLVGIEELSKAKLSTLSGGQRQRAYIARALVSECKLLICDEPTASLDSQSSVQIFELLQNLHQKGVGVIVICHDISLALAYANKIAHLSQKLTLHTNEASLNLEHIRHLSQKHSHFCAVEMNGVCECKH